jgi:hypothetical protein
MLFMSRWETLPEYRNSNFQAFSRLPDGDPVADGGNELQLIGRWHDLAGTSGVAIFECADPKAIAQWAIGWSTTTNIEITPVVDDAGAKAIGAALNQEAAL